MRLRGRQQRSARRCLQRNGRRVSQLYSSALIWGLLMSVWSTARALLATIVLAGASSFALAPAQADGGRIQFTVVKAGLVIGGSGGSGTLSFKGRRYALSIGGLRYGLPLLVFPDQFRGKGSNNPRPPEVGGGFAGRPAGGGAAPAPPRGV